MELGHHFEDFFEEYKRQRERLGEMQRKMSEISATASSPRREVTITVGQNGVLTDIQFANGAYRRMTPADLTAAILSTYAEAKEAVNEKAADLLAPTLPAGLDAKALVRGEAGVDAFLPAEPRVATSVREILSRFNRADAE
ncbi:YbaB/EbfC family nucleoid-associated protein [Actinoplanes sp. CA-131856]